MSRSRVKELERPVVLGFQTVAMGTRPADAWRTRRLLAAYAEREGLALGRVFVHVEGSGQPGALGDLLRAAVNPQVVAVAVVSLVDLSRSPRVRRMICARLKVQAGVEVRVVGAELRARAPVRAKPLVPKPEPEEPRADPSRILVGVVTTTGQARFVELRVRLETVEAWYVEGLVAIFDRNRLHEWLSRPSGWIAEGSVVFSVDPRPSEDRVEIELPDVRRWTLSAQEQASLKARV